MAPRARIAVYKALWSTQDASTGQRLDLRPRRRHRPGRRRRRRRHQLLDQRHADELPRPGRDRVPVRRRRRHLRRRSRPATTARPLARSRTRARGSPPSLPARTTATARARSRSATARPTTARRSRRRSARRRSSTPRPSASPGADPTTLALCFTAGDNGGTAVLDPAKVAGKIVVCDRGVNARVNKSLAVQQAGGVGHDPRQHERQLDQRRLPLRADRPPAGHGPRRRQGLRGDGGRDGDDQPVDDRVQRPGAVHGVVLVARPARARAAATCSSRT